MGAVHVCDQGENLPQPEIPEKVKMRGRERRREREEGRGREKGGERIREKCKMREK